MVIEQLIFFAQGSRPNPGSAPYVPPEGVTSRIDYWLDVTLYVGLVLSILATIAFGALLAADKERGEPVSATAPHVRALRLAIGVLIATSAGALATWFS